MSFGLSPGIGNSFNSNISAVSNAANIFSALNPNPQAANPSQDLISWNSQDLLPNNGGFIDPFFNFYANDGTRFQTVYGYDFVISKNGQPTNILFLPLAPENIKFRVPVATNIAVTMKGITEDNNAAPLRYITISGTTGTWHTTAPADNSASTVSNTLNYLFKNTIQAANNVATQLNKTIAAFSGSPQATAGPLNYQTPTAAATVNSSGYWLFQNLVRFLDFYIANKKTRAGKDMRFTFEMHKDEMYYDCILTNYSWEKVAGTLEYKYTIELTAYRRRPRPLTNDTASAQPTPTQATPLNAFASIINGLQQVQNLIAAASNVITGVEADAQADLFTPLREAILLGKDALGLATTLADMPQAIINSAKASVQSALLATTGSAAQLRQSVDQLMSQTYGLTGSPSQPGTSALTTLAAATSQNGQSQLAVQPETSSPAELIFQNPTYYSPVFALFDLSSLTLSNPVAQSVQDEVDRVRNLTIAEWMQRRDRMRMVAVAVSESFGGGSAAYNQLLGIPPPQPTNATLSTDNIATLSQINDAIMGVDAIISQLQQANPNATNNYFSFYQSYAVSNGIAFNTSTSKFFVPFPTNGTLEQVASQYLGDYSRWIEIAALNGLQEPYVDEVGFQVPLLMDASESSVYVADPTNLYVGETVFVGSSAVVQVPRQIETIQEIQESYWLITFTDGPTLLGIDAADGAYIQAYLPNTINGTMLVAIPSDQPVNVPGKIQLTPDVADLNGLGAIAGVDFLLTSDGQLSLNASGDVQLATGMTNLVQAANIRVQTPLGSMIQWPTYGNPIQPGTSIATVNAVETLRDLSRQFSQDPRFTGILAGQIIIDGPGAALQFLLGVSGGQVNLPIQSQLPLGSIPGF